MKFFHSLIFQLIHLSGVFRDKTLRSKNPGFMLMRLCDVMISCHLAASQPVMLTSGCHFYVKYSVIAKQHSAGTIGRLPGTIINLAIERARSRDELTGQFLTPHEVNSQSQ